MDISKYITDVPDFPEKGVVFKDITPLLKNNLPELIDHLYSLVDWNEIDYVVGIESRGFILGSALALRAKKGLVLVRKKGKLPPPVISETYELEYGTDTLEIKENNEKARVLVVDDVLATGGTLKATFSLCEKANYQVQQSMVLINLTFLNKMQSEGHKIISLMDL